MTLVKTKPKRPSLEHRKRHGHHHRHSHEYVKAYWPYLPITVILAAGLLANCVLGRVNKDVLGYATDMSTTSLLIDTNQQRVERQETSLNLNIELDHAAQAKADDMAARGYWSHNTPDGKTPWSFMTAAGYNYQIAGENLAYGFATADDAVTGWMNSPEHRANILNAAFHDVGFGIVNIADYQNSGPETLVVAMYGSLPDEAGVLGLSPQQNIGPATNGPAAVIAQKQDTVEPAQQPVTQLELVSSNTPLNAFAVTLLGISACAFLIGRHSWAWHRLLVKGERFVLHHPLLDLTAVTVVAVVLALSHTAGLIR